MKAVPDIVNRNFSRAAKTYDSYAGAQRIIAGRLLDLIREHYASANLPEAVLEAGCGTGFLSEGLFGIFPSAKFAITDISVEMLRICSEKYSSSLKDRGISADFRPLDIGRGIDCSGIDLFASSLAFQWIEDQRALMGRIHRALSPRGILAFSTLGRGTFGNVRKVFESLGIAYPAPELPDEREIRCNCSMFAECRSHKEMITHEFGSAKAFFGGLQKTGSANATGAKIGAAEMRKILREFGRGPFRTSYEAVYVICRK